MNAPSLTRHLLLKDLRHQRGWLALLWAYTLLLPVTARLVNGTGDSLMPLAVAVFFLIAAIVLGRLIQLDAPGRRLNFLATRPVPWSVLLAEKALFIAAFLVAPVWIAKFGTIFLLGIPVNATDAALILLENTLRVGALLAGVALFACFFRNLWVASLFMAGTAVLFLLCTAFFRSRAFAGGLASMEQGVALNNSRLFVFFAALIAVVAVTVIFRYRLRSLRMPLCILVAGLALSLALWNFWPYNLVGIFPDKTQNMEGPGDKVKVTLTGSVRGSSGGSMNGIPYVGANADIAVEGVDLPYFIRPAGFHGEATLKSGRTIQTARMSEGMSFVSMRDIWSAPMMQKLAGFKPRMGAFSDWNPRTVELFDFEPGQYPNEDLTGVTIKGDVTFSLCKLVIVKTMPFASGGELRMPRMNCILRDVVFSPSGASCKIITNSVNSILRGDSTLFGDWGRSWLVFNRGKNEYLSPDGNSSGGSRGMFCDVSTGDERLRLDPQDPMKQPQPMPGDWADGAEISFFTVQQCGQITIPFEVKNVDLSH